MTSSYIPGITQQSLASELAFQLNNTQTQLSDQFQKTIELNANAQQSYATQTQSIAKKVSSTCVESD